jgi:SAM-dependent methyltransferase
MYLSLRNARAVLAAGLLAVCAPTWAQKAPAADYKPEVGQPGKDVVWVPTPDEVVDKMLEMAQVKAGEQVVDLGSGDGKIAIAAAKRGAKARGIEYNPDMVALSKRNAQAAGVKVDFEQGDIFKSNFKNADVVTLYLLPSLNEQLRPILLDMKPGTRVTSHQFRMGDWEPDETASLANRQAHLWIVPAKVQGRWEVRMGNATPIALNLTQTYQMLTGEATVGDSKVALADAKLRGDTIAFALPGANGGAQRFEGKVAGRNRISGEAVGADGKKVAFVASRK